MISNEKKELIALEVIKLLHRRVKKFPYKISDERNAPFHKEILNSFSTLFFHIEENNIAIIGLNSWLNGLNTAMGFFFEKLAHILSNSKKEMFTNANGNLLRSSQEQQETITNIMTHLKNGTNNPDLVNENERIFQDGLHCDQDASGFVADVYLESDGGITAIELKSVRPNSGEMSHEKQKILKAKAALYCKYPDNNIKYYIGFPFDPTSSSPYAYNKRRFLKYIVDGEKFFDPSEVLLSNELWNYLSGERDTMQKVVSIISNIAKPEFESNFKYVNVYKNSSKYRKQLEKWYLYKEIEIIDRCKMIKDKETKKKATSILKRRLVFLSDGEYNEKRYDAVKALLN